MSSPVASAIENVVFAIITELCRLSSGRSKAPLTLTYAPIARNTKINSKTKAVEFDGTKFKKLKFKEKLKPQCEQKKRKRPKTLQEMSTRTLVFPSHSENPHFALVLRAFQLTHSSLVGERHLTLRDVYYLDTQLFRSQAWSNWAITAVTDILRMTRDSLNVVASPRGLVCGSFSYTLDGKTVDCQAVTPISPFSSEITSVSGQFQFALVVEKETVFQRIVSSGFLEANPCVLITGKGYPCLATRKLLARVNELHPTTPMYCLVDCDPHGMSIFAQYKFGSIQHSLESLGVTTMTWLGLRADELSRLHLPKSCRVKLTNRDKSLIDSMMERKSVRNDPELSKQLQCLKRSQQKVELDALTSIEPNYLTNHYISDQISRHQQLIKGNARA